MGRKTRKNDKMLIMLDSSGIKIDNLEDKNRSFKHNLLVCIWNAFLIFLFVYGLSGFFIESFNLPCSSFRLMLYTAVFSVFMAMFYLNRLCFNLGYIALLLFIIIYSLSNYMYINSGFSAIQNLIIVAIDKELNLPSLREFSEFITNRYATITSCFVLINCVACCFFNMIISRRKKLTSTVIITIIIFEISIYLNDSFSYFYLIIVLLAFTLYIFTKQSDEQPVDYLKKQKSFIVKKNRAVLKERLPEYVGSIISAICFVLLTLVISLIIFSFVPSTYINSNSDLKDKTDEIVYDVAMQGISALFGNSSNGTGGMNNGTFGDVNSISFDYETDLEVTLVPYSYEPVYIPTFYANTYDNNLRKWYLSDGCKYENEVYDLISAEVYDSFSEYTYTYQTLINLKNGQLKTSEDSSFAESSVLIKNVNAASSFPARMYYTDSVVSASTVNIAIGAIADFRVSPLLYNYDSLPFFEEKSVFLKKTDKTHGSYTQDEYNYNSDSLDEFAEKYYTLVPDDISDSLQDICREKDFGGSTTEIIDQIINFMAEDYAYSLSPGKTPDDEDFVLYFLQDSKQGFCVHFASAACLLLREMGIPAKYVEGYCFDYTAYDDAVLFSDNMTEEYEDYMNKKYIEYDSKNNGDNVIDDSDRSAYWYDGYNPLDFNEPVSIELTDANAHAWVEVYFEGFGWVPVEFTVGALADDENYSQLDSILGRLMNSSGNSEKVNSDDGTAFDNITETITKTVNSGLKNLLILVVILFALIIVVKKVILCYRLYLCNPKNRAVNQYKYLCKMVRKDLIRKNKSYREKLDELIISHSVLVTILHNEYDVSRNVANYMIGKYEEYNYSENKQCVDIDTLTSYFRNITGRISSCFGIFRRITTAIYLYFPGIKNVDEITEVSDEG